MPPNRRAPAQAAGPARQAALRILLRVSQSGAWASRLLESLDVAQFDPRDLALLHEIVLGVLRWRGRIDWELEGFSRRPLETLEPAILEALRIGVYQLLFLDRVPAHAAVNGSVELARRACGPGPAGFVNAILRRIAEATERAEKTLPRTARGGQSRAKTDARAVPAADSRGLIQTLAQDLANDLSHPPWMVERALARFGLDGARAWLLANNQPAPIVLRPNPRHAKHQDLARALRDEGVMTEPGRLVPGALRVIEGHPVRTQLFREGAFWIQDEGSQLVPLLFPPPWSGLTADLCAAPGGKSFVLASGEADHRILALDLHPHRLVRMRQGAARIGAESIGMAVGDAASAPPAAEGAFDRVLVDAPCSGTGVLRRHPEIRWRVGPEQIEELAQLQARLLDRGLELLRPGGYLVYSVCSVEPEEGERVLEAFLRRSGCRVVDPRGHFPASATSALDSEGLLRTLPHVHDSDGFFAALVRKPGSIG